MADNYVIIKKLTTSISNSDSNPFIIKPVYEDITKEELDNIPDDEILMMFNYLTDKKQSDLLFNIKSWNRNNFKIFMEHVVARNKNYSHIIISDPVIFFPICYDVFYNYFKFTNNIKLPYSLLSEIHKSFENHNGLGILDICNFEITNEFIKQLPRLIEGRSPLLIQFVKKYHDNREYMECLLEDFSDNRFIDTFNIIMRYDINISKTTLIKILGRMTGLDKTSIEYIATLLGKD